MIINNKHYKYVFVSHYLNKKQNSLDETTYLVFKNFSKNSLIILIKNIDFEKSSYIENQNYQTKPKLLPVLS